MRNKYSIAFALTLFICLTAAGSASAQMKSPRADMAPKGMMDRKSAEDPHKAKEASSGMITGTLFGADGSPFGDHPVMLQVYHSGEPILTVPKKTAADGSYSFKNIFLSQDFSYSIVAEHEGNMYTTEAVSLGPDERTRRLDLKINADSEAEAVAAKEPAVQEHGKHGASCGTKLDEFQILAIILGICAIGYVVFRKTRRPAKT